MTNVLSTFDQQANVPQISGKREVVLKGLAVSNRPTAANRCFQQVTRTMHPQTNVLRKLKEEQLKTWIIDNFPIQINH